MDSSAMSSLNQQTKPTKITLLTLHAVDMDKLPRRGY